MTTSRIDVFKQILESEPDNTTVIFGLANEYLKAEQYEEAVITLNDYISRADDEGAAYGMLARAYEQLGKRGKAKEAFERGITVAEAHGHPSMAEDYRMTLESNYED